MDSQDKLPDRWPSLLKDDEGLQQDILSLLSERVTADPYGTESVIAEQLLLLPVGLRAMGATHYLDVSLTLDSITWHFGNFGEPRFVALTEAGLRELGLNEMADCFQEAGELILPILGEIMSGERDEVIRQHGLEARVDELDGRAWDMDGGKPGTSVIYDAWIKYAREYPERVFG
jgi:hypothetical protein